MKRGLSRSINLMVMELRCKRCGVVYRKHKEHRIQCPSCGMDYGFIITLEELKHVVDNLPDV